MARIEYMKLRLENWALWKAREAGGGLGFASQSSFLNEYDSGRYREAHIPVDETDAAATNDAVEALLPTREHLYTTLQCIYPLGMGIRGAARHCHVAESSIRARLEQADLVLMQWFRDRSDAAKVFAAKRSFTT